MMTVLCGAACLLVGYHGTTYLMDYTNVSGICEGQGSGTARRGALLWPRRGLLALPPFLLNLPY